jgi:hypothetical protein
MFIEQWNSFGFEPTFLIFLWEIVVVHFEVESVAFLIEFDWFLGVDFLIIKFEFVIFELWNLKVGIKVDWRLLTTQLTDKVLGI